MPSRLRGELLRAPSTGISYTRTRTCVQQQQQQLTTVATTAWNSRSHVALKTRARGSVIRILGIAVVIHLGFSGLALIIQVIIRILLVPLQRTIELYMTKTQPTHREPRFLSSSNATLLFSEPRQGVGYTKTNKNQDRNKMSFSRFVQTLRTLRFVFSTRGAKHTQKKTIFIAHDLCFGNARTPLY